MERAEFPRLMCGRLDDIREGVKQVILLKLAPGVPGARRKWSHSGVLPASAHNSFAL